MCTQNAFDVAERALALTLAFYGRVIEFHEDLKNEIWHGFWVNKGSEDNWDSLYGKTCSVLGVGAIGQELAKLLKAFHCVVYGYRRTQNASIPEGFDAILPTIDQAIDSSEIIFITLPATFETENLISKEMLYRMQGKFLVNMGRGSIVNEEGLYTALQEGILKVLQSIPGIPYPDTRGSRPTFPFSYPQVAECSAFSPCWWFNESSKCKSNKGYNGEYTVLPSNWPRHLAGRFA